MGESPVRLDAVAQAELVRRGELSAAELVEAAIDRVESLNPTFNAAIHPLFTVDRDEYAGALATLIFVDNAWATDFWGDPARRPE